MSVYLQAAELVDSGEGEFSCCAIQTALQSGKLLSSIPECVAYDSLFRPAAPVFSDAWGYYWGKSDKKRKACRVLALCFMHWISEDLK